MKNWQDILINSSSPIIKALEIIEASSMQIALVVNKNRRLLGTVTDGDIRRGILKGLSFNEPVNKIMCLKPSVARLGEGYEHILTTMKARQLHQLPLIDDYGCVVGLETWDELFKINELENLVILMAGGMGSRLKELTKDCPKPLLKVGNKPVLETILENCKEYGFNKFYISVNYKSEMITEYFGDGTRWGVEINYLEETKKLGTAGALSLLPEKPVLPALVINGDLLTKVNLQHLLSFHSEQKATATMCVREYDFQVPYGVVTIDNNKLLKIDEKPVHKFFVSAGIYVIEPSAFDVIPKDMHFDMPTLFESLIGKGYDTAAFPTREYWIDIGRMNDLERAEIEYSETFK